MSLARIPVRAYTRAGEDGDDISYVKCLRSLSETASRTKTEHLLPLATVLLNAPCEGSTAGAAGAAGAETPGLRVKLAYEEMVLEEARVEAPLGTPAWAKTTYDVTIETR